jgi:hypothetical protein
MIFGGYEAGLMAYQAYDPATKCIHITCDVMFDEEAKWHWGENKIDSEFIIVYIQADHCEL